ncbi:hypothetical protein WC29P3_00046 [Weissella phage WC29P3]|nr:hypothetical protein WC29P3_00046 [Weissella phage WC29P3]
MTDKAYIVANKEQELDVLKKLQQNNLFWLNGAMPTNFVPSKHSASMLFEQFPYIIVEGDEISWINVKQLTDEEIVYDGRNEENMYKVTQEFMNELIKWRDDNDLDTKTSDGYVYVDGRNILNVTDVIDTWWIDPDDPIENNNRLIAIIQWLNGEDVFEVEETHKFVVRNDTLDYDLDYYYVQIFDGVTDCVYSLEGATRFDTLEEAQEWANSHQVVVEIDAEGNEVE